MFKFQELILASKNMCVEILNWHEKSHFIVAAHIQRGQTKTKCFGEMKS